MKKEFNQIYIVKEGDSLDKIASIYNVSPLSILLTNNITPKMLKKGMKNGSSKQKKCDQTIKQRSKKTYTQ